METPYFENPVLELHCT